MAKPNIKTFALFGYDLKFAVKVRDWVRALGAKARVVDPRSWVGEREHEAVAVLIHRGASPDELARLKAIHDGNEGATPAPYAEDTDDAAKAVALKLCGLVEKAPETPKGDEQKPEGAPQVTRFSRGVHS